jgi:adenylate cyclase
VAISCGACGAGLRDGARFCDACGALVAGGDRHAEYKQVTVLFADVVHSMDIAAALGTERLREIMADLVNRSSRIVQRYGGTVDKFTGDGIMAVFGAPVALEDHALRACRAALDIQKDVKSLDDEVGHRDHLTLQLRIGLNSGEVITGDIGSGPLGYTAVGEQVGMAQRMESVAPPGGVMVTESTARLVQDATLLSEPEPVAIKGSRGPVSARRLLGIASGRRIGRAEPRFVGRQWEMDALWGLLDRAVNGNGCVVGVVGPPGIGKSRIVRELTSRAADRGAEVFATYCESHTTDVPFQAAAGLLRSATGSEGVDGAAARTRVRVRFSEADEEDLVLLEDLLGIGDPTEPLPQIDPDARRRRLATMINAAALARPTPAVYVIEDVHWIDEISESLLADILSVVSRTRTLVLITYRPEYAGILAHMPRSQTIALEPLDDSQMSQLSTELLGKDRSVAGLAELVTEHAAGNPFFAEEIVRDLTERDVLIGGRGCYLCVEPAREVSVPSTLQAVIAARIDRLDPVAKRTLNAAAVIGSQFSPDMLAALEITPALDDLVVAELIDQTAFGSRPQYAFRHALTRAVAYESQLKADRAQLHRRLAATIEQQDYNAALIAEHLESAGDLPAAYEWHMRAGAWSTNRDISAAHHGWERARQIADTLPADHENLLAMRIAPRTLMCGNGFRSHVQIAGARFDELRDLCALAGDKSSLAIAMAGLIGEHFMQGRVDEATQLRDELMELVESVADPTLTIALAVAPITVSLEIGDAPGALRLSQMVIDLADGDASRGSMIVGSPLAAAFASRSHARWALGEPGWRDDIERAIEMASAADAMTYGLVLVSTYEMTIAHGVVLADDTALRRLDAALHVIERSSDELGLAFVSAAYGVALLQRSLRERERGVDLLAAVREMCLDGRYYRDRLPIVNAWAGNEMVRRGDRPGGLPLIRESAETLLGTGQVPDLTVATRLLVEALLDGGNDDDIREAEAAIERLSKTPGKGPWVTRDLVLLRLRALLAKARGDEPTYHDFRDRYRAMADDFGFDGHIQWAAKLP